MAPPPTFKATDTGYAHSEHRSASGCRGSLRHGQGVPGGAVRRIATLEPSQRSSTKRRGHAHHRDSDTRRKVRPDRVGLPAQLKLGHHPVPEAIAFFEKCCRAWPDRGANQRGLAEFGCDRGESFRRLWSSRAKRLKIDRRATGMEKEALDSRLGEDLAVLAWAVAVNSGMLARSNPC